MSLNLLVMQDGDDYPSDDKVIESVLAFREYPSGDYSLRVECSPFPMLWNRTRWHCKLYVGFLTPTPTEPFPADSLLVVVAGKPRDEGNKNGAVIALAKALGAQSIDTRHVYIGSKEQPLYYQGFVVAGVTTAKLLELKAKVENGNGWTGTVQ